MRRCRIRVPGCDGHATPDHRPSARHVGFGGNTIGEGEKLYSRSCEKRHEFRLLPGRRMPFGLGG
ncbi:hypothetical protein HVPorG_04976 [Roseomonas mucosa]|nr:hypothetical protein HVPorG_04976 [Roseomonas mucosa]